MTTTRTLFVFILALLVAVAACRREEEQAAAPKSDKVQELAARWTLPAAEQEIEATLNAYKALSPEEMEEFIRLEADYRVKVLGQEEALMAQYKEARLEMHRLAVKELGVGLNQLDGEQIATLEQKPVMKVTLTHLNEAFTREAPAFVENLPRSASGRTEDDRIDERICTVYPSGYNSCTRTYNAYFNDGVAVLDNTRNSMEQCAFDWGHCRDLDQTDCDYYFHFTSLFTPVDQDLNRQWRFIFGNSPAVRYVISLGTPPYENHGRYVNSPDYFRRSILVGKGRVDLIGGGPSYFANYIILGRLY